VAEILAQRVQPAYASQITENGNLLGIHGVEERNGFVEEQVIASGDDQQAVIRWELLGRFGEIACIGLDPPFHEVFGEEPFSGDFSCRQAFFGDQRVHHFFVYIEKGGNFLCRHQVFHIDNPFP